MEKYYNASTHVTLKAFLLVYIFTSSWIGESEFQPSKQQKVNHSWPFFPKPVCVDEWKQLQHEAKTLQS